MVDLLVTGGAGFIGANFVRYWAKRYPADRITVLDALTYAGNRQNLAGLDQVRLVEADIRDTGRVLDLLTGGIGTIVHFAAETHVDRSIGDPDLFIDVNVAGTHSLLKAARAAWLADGKRRLHRFHHVSTDEVYGSLGADDPPVTEATPYAPSSPYSASKAASDHLVRAYFQTYGLETVVTSCSNNYGPYQYPDKLIPLFIVNCLLGRPLPIYGDGLNVRDWLYVDDHCRGIELALLKGRPGVTYNISGDAEMPNQALIALICETVDHAFARDPGLAARFPEAPAAWGEASATLRTYVPDRAGHDRRYAIDCSRIREDLDYRPGWALREGLASTIRWYLDNEAWWRPAIPAGQGCCPPST